MTCCVGADSGQELRLARADGLARRGPVTTSIPKRIERRSPARSIRPLRRIIARMD